MPHAAFVEDLSRRIAAYTGGDRVDAVRIAAGLDAAGDQLPDRIADYMLEDVRRSADRAAYDDLRRVTVRNLREEWDLNGPAAGYVGDQEAVANSRAVYALAVARVEPEAVRLGVPRALERERTQRLQAALRTLRAVPPERLAQTERLERWALEANRLRDERPGAKRQADLALLAQGLDRELAGLAGDRRTEPRTSTRSPDDTLRDGVGLSVARRVGPAFAEAYGIADVLAEAGPPRSDRFEGGLVDGMAFTIAERTGRSEGEVVDVLCATGESGDQWEALSTMLTPDEALGALPPQMSAQRVRSEVKYAMRDEFSQHYGNPDRWPEVLTPEEVGARVAEAGLRVAGNFGVQHSDPALAATLNAASTGQRPLRTAAPLTATETAALAAVTQPQHTAQQPEL